MLTLHIYKPVLESLEDYKQKFDYQYAHQSRFGAQRINMFELVDGFLLIDESVREQYFSK